MQKLSRVFEKITFFLFLFLVVFIPLYPKLPLFNVAGTFVAIRVEDFLIALLSILWFATILLKGKLKELLREPLNQLLLLFFFIGLVSLFSAVFVTNTVMWHLGLLHFIRRAEFMIFLPIAYFLINTKRDLKIVLILFGIVTLLVNVYAFGQQLLGWPVISTTNSEFSKGLILELTAEARVNSTFAGHYDLGVFMAMVITVLAALFFAVKGWLLKGSILILSAMSFVVLVMTAARLSFLAVLVGVTMSLILTGKKIFILLLILLAVGAVLYPSQLRDRLVSTFIVNFQQQGERYDAPNQEQEVRSRLNIPTLPIYRPSFLPATATDSTDVASDIAPGEPTDSTQLGVYRSFEIRLNLEWPRAIRAFQKNPLLGTGYSSMGLATDNDYLRLLGEVGALGAYGFFLIIFLILKRLTQIYKTAEKFDKYLIAGIISMFGAFLINAIFIDVFEASKVAAILWIMLGVGLAIKKFK